MNTLDYNITITTMLFSYSKETALSQSLETLVNNDILAIMIKRKLKHINYDLSLIQNYLKVSSSKFGIKLTLSCHTLLLKENLKKMEREVNVEKKLNENLKLDFEELLFYQQQFKELLGFHVVVQYSKSKEAGEIRINFKNEKDLDYLLDKMI